MPGFPAGPRELGQGCAERIDPGWVGVMLQDHWAMSPGLATTWRAVVSFRPATRTWLLALVREAPCTPPTLNGLLCADTWAEQYRRPSVAIASNESFSGWPKAFTDPRLRMAIVDRLTFNGAGIQTGPDSCRLAHTKPKTNFAPDSPVRTWPDYPARAA